MPIRPRRKPVAPTPRSAVMAAAAAPKSPVTRRNTAPYPNQLLSTKNNRSVFYKGIPIIRGKGPTVEGAAPVLQNPPARSYDPQAPPPSTQGQTIRDTSAKSWTDAQAAYNQGVFKQALGLGDPEVMRALSGDPDFQALFAGVDTSKPTAGSTYERLGREETSQLYDTDVNRNAGGSYFSGFRLKDRADVSKNIADQRAQALKDYRDAIQGLGEDRTTSYNAYLAAQGEASGADLATAEANEPAVTPRQYSKSELKKAQKQKEARAGWKAWRKKHPQKKKK